MIEILGFVKCFVVENLKKFSEQEKKDLCLKGCFFNLV